MLLVTMPNTPSSRYSGEYGKSLAFYLAAEEYIAANLRDILSFNPGFKECFMMWQVPPTVIFGRNQDISAEVNLKYCRDRGIRVFRRRSGGGCVYADEGNIMLSYITASTHVDFTFAAYLERVALALRQMGLPAVRSEHNDVLVGGSKVSGNACFLVKDTCIVHGTLMYDVDVDEMESAITPSREKLESHGVQSVRARVANLKGLLEESGAGVDITSFKRKVISSFCPERRRWLLSAADVAEIEKIALKYEQTIFTTKQ